MAEATIYENRTDRDHIARLYEIVDLARIGAASTDTVLNVANLLSAQTALYDMIHRLASEAVDFAEAMGSKPLAQAHDMDASSLPRQAPDSPAKLFADFMMLTAQWKNTAAAIAPGDAEGPEVEILSEQVEAMCKRIADSTPTTQADCHAMLQWALEDSRGEIYHPSHRVVQQKVADFLVRAT